MEQHRDRDRRVTDENEPGENAPSRGEFRRQLLVIESERLKKARCAVAQMEGKQKHAEDVEPRHEIILKAVDHHRINVIAVQRIGFQKKKTRIGHTNGEMREMIKDEGEQD